MLTLDAPPAPVKPLRRTFFSYIIPIDYGVTYDEIKREVEKLGEIDPDDVFVDYDNDGDDVHFCLKHREVESDESFALRMERYDEEVAQYETWQRENSDAIEQHKRTLLLGEKQSLLRKLVELDEQIERELGGEQNDQPTG